MRAENAIEEDAMAEGTIRTGCRRAMRVACEPEARLNLARDRVRDAADMLRVDRVDAEGPREGVFRSKLLLSYPYWSCKDGRDDRRRRRRRRCFLLKVQTERQLARVLLVRATFFSPSHDVPT